MEIQNKYAKLVRAVEAAFPSANVVTNVTDYGANFAIGLLHDGKSHAWWVERMQRTGPTNYEMLPDEDGVLVKTVVPPFGYRTVSIFDGTTRAEAQDALIQKMAKFFGLEPAHTQESCTQ